MIASRTSRKFIAAVAASVVGLGATTSAIALAAEQTVTVKVSDSEVELTSGAPGGTLTEAIEQELDSLGAEYSRTRHEAEKAGIDSVEALPADANVDEIVDATEALEERIERYEKRNQFASPESYGVSQATLDAIAACESGGDPTVISADGLYHGKYQFSLETWAAMGGSGDPAAAPEAEQDMRAAMLYSQSGPGQWPVCGV